MVTKICYHVVEFQHFISFVLLLQSSIERNLWHGVVSGCADCAVGPICSGRSRETRRTRRPSLSGRASRSWWPWLSTWTPRTHPPDAPRLSLRTLDKRRKRLNEAVVFDGVGRLGCGRGRRPVRVAHHLTGSEHLITRGSPGGVHHDRDQNHQHQHQRDATNTSCDHLRSAESRCSPELMVFQPACGRYFCRGKNFAFSRVLLQLLETKQSFKCWCAKVSIHNFYALQYPSDLFISAARSNSDKTLSERKNKTKTICVM